ncbi:ABC transporter substrate-binding protein [Pseudogracilibacillus sp. ICA-222130]|uniref:ABC transporter substrate-binding protein n=1 Tax=Pseudogracilibacillus sp. ICA-222130 TaxID=3134655 RepID=UPI0030C42BE1
MFKKVLPILVVMSLFVACSNNDTQVNDVTEDTNVETEEAEFPVTVEVEGKEVTVEAAPKNILPMSLEVAEIVLELTTPENVTATTKGIDDPLLSTKVEEGKQIEERIGAATNVDTEEIIALDTDLLIMTKMYGQEEDAEDVLSQFDTPILSFSPFVTVEKFQDAALIIGEAIGKKEMAIEKVDQMNEEIEAIQEKIPEGDTPSVLVLSEVGGDMGPFMLGPTNISYDLVQLAGATPATDSIDLERSGPAEMEQIINMDPDYIVLLDFFGKGEKSFSDLMEDPGWKTLTAVKEDKIMLEDAKYILNPNFENAKGLEKLVDFIYE